MNYLVVLFKNKVRKKIINKFMTLENAKKFFNNKIKENENVYFEKQVENSLDCKFDLCILEKKNNNFDVIFVKDDLGRQIKADLDDSMLRIMEISPYKMEETIYDINKDKKITLITFYKNYIYKKGIVLLSRLNNKIIIQEDNSIFLFSLKNELESKRFLKTLSGFLVENSILNCIIVSETSKVQKKYLYDLLGNLGISKKLLYRTTTTYKPR